MHSAALLPNSNPNLDPNPNPNPNPNPPQSFVASLLQLKAQDRLTAEEALAHRWLSRDAPPSPGALLSSSQRPVKTLLSEFNAQRMLGR